MTPINHLLALLQNGWLIIEVILIFGVLILAHELGHFIAAKWTGMRVDEFAIGFGKRLISWKKGETIYSLNLFPLGGYNKIYGMDLEDQEPDSTEETEKRAEKSKGKGRGSKAKETLAPDYSIAPPDDPRAFANRPLGQRFAVIVAGSLANILVAIVVIFGMGVILGFPAAELGEVIPNGPAANAGLMAGDIITDLEGFPIAATDDLHAAVASSDGKPLNLKGLRNGEEFTATVIPLPIRLIDSHFCRLGFAYLNDGTVYYSLPGTPAGRAGLTRGDLILNVDGLRFPSHNLDIESGNGITYIDVFRGLGALRIGIDHFDNEFVEGTYSPFGFLYSQDLLVTAVLPDSIAADAGLSAGDQIVESAQNTWTAAPGEPEGPSKALTVTYERNGAQHRARMVPDESFSRIQVFMDNASLPVLNNLPYNHRLYQAGLRSGDRILSVAGSTTGSGISALLEFERMVGKTVSVVAMVKGSERIFDVRIPGESDRAGMREFLSGLHFNTKYYRADPLTSFVAGIRKCGDIVALIIKTIQYLVSGKASVDAIAGPVGIASFTYDAARNGLVDLINMLVLLTINLGVFNLLPFPALDGGRLIFMVAEGIFRRPVVTVRVENLIHIAGLLLLVLFALFVTYHDIVRRLFSN